jgi:hypothetical protein
MRRHTHAAVLALALPALAGCGSQGKDGASASGSGTTATTDTRTTPGTQTDAVPPTKPKSARAACIERAGYTLQRRGTYWRAVPTGQGAFILIRREPSLAKARAFVHELPRAQPHARVGTYVVLGGTPRGARAVATCWRTHRS